MTEMQNTVLSVLLFSALLPFQEVFGCVHQSRSHKLKGEIHAIVCPDISAAVKYRDQFLGHFRNKFLEFAPSNITTLPALIFANFPDITELHLNNHHIRNISPGAFDELSHVKELQLGENDLTEVYSDVFSSLHALEILNLTSNNIFAIDRFALKGLSNLKKLYLRNNKIFKVDGEWFGTVTQLEFFDLSGNPVQRFYDPWNVHTVDLSSCDLPTLNELFSNGTYSMIELNLSDNSLSAIEGSAFQNLVNLSSLDLHHNRITKLKMFDGLEGLLKLNLSLNQISSVDNDTFFNPYLLEVLDLHGNNLTKIEEESFSNLEGLKFLDLSHNKIEQLSLGSFDSLIELRVLNVSNNRLKDLLVVYSLPALENFNFDNNLVEKLQLERAPFYTSGTIRTISLINNSWTCDELILVRNTLKDKHCALVRGDQLEVKNVYGIACDLYATRDNKTSVLTKETLKTLGSFPRTLGGEDCYNDFFYIYVVVVHLVVVVLLSIIVYLKLDTSHRKQSILSEIELS